MKKSGFMFWGVVFTSLLLLNIYTLYQKNTLSLKVEETALALNGSYENLRSIQKQVISREVLQFRDEGVLVNGGLMLSIGPENDQESYELRNLLTDDYTLIVNLPQIDCTSCSDQELMVVKKLSEKVNPDKILIMSRYRIFNDMQVFKRLNQLELDVYNKNDGNLGLSAEQENVPFMFLTRPDLMTRYLFIPDHEIPELTEEYFDLITKIMVAE